MYRLHAFQFGHATGTGTIAFCRYDSNVYNYNTRYTASQSLPKFRVKTNTGKQMISFMAIDLWQEIPCKFKNLN